MGVILKKKKLKVIPHKKSTKVNWQKEEIREKYREDRHPTPHDRKDYKIADGKKVYKYKKLNLEQKVELLMSTMKETLNTLKSNNTWTANTWKACKN